MSKVVDELKLFLNNLSRGSDTVGTDDLLDSGIADKSVILNIKAKLGESPWNIQNLIDLGIDIIQKDNENELELKHDSSDNIISEAEIESESEREKGSERKRGKGGGREKEKEKEGERESSTERVSKNRNKNEQNVPDSEEEIKSGADNEIGDELESEIDEDDFYNKSIKFEKNEHIEETLRVMIQRNTINLHPIVKEFILLLIFLFNCFRSSKNNSENGIVFFEKNMIKEFNENKIDKCVMKNEKKTKINYIPTVCDNPDTFYRNMCSKNSTPNYGTSDIRIDSIYKRLVNSNFPSDRDNKDILNCHENFFYNSFCNIFLILHEKSKYEYNIDDVEQAFSIENLNKVCESLYKHLHKIRKIKDYKLLKKGINIIIVLLYLTFIYFGSYFLKTKNLFIKLYCLEKDFIEDKNKHEKIKSGLHKKIDELLYQLKISEKYTEEYDKCKEDFNELKKENEKLKNSQVLIQKLKKKITLMETEKLVILKKKEELDIIIKQKNLLIESSKIKKSEREKEREREKEIKHPEIKKTKLLLKNECEGLNRIKSFSRKSENNNGSHIYSVGEKKKTNDDKNAKKKVKLMEDRHTQTSSQEKEKYMVKKLKQNKISVETQTLKYEYSGEINKHVLNAHSYVHKHKEKMVKKLHDCEQWETQEKQHNAYSDIYILKNISNFLNQMSYLLNMKVKEDMKNKSVLTCNASYHPLYYEFNKMKREKEAIEKNGYSKFYLHFNKTGFKVSDYISQNIDNMNKEILVENMYNYLINKYNTFDEIVDNDFFYEFLNIFFIFQKKKK